MYIALEVIQLIEVVAILILAWRYRSRFPSSVARFGVLMFLALLLGLRCSELLVELGVGADTMHLIRNLMEAAATSSLLVAALACTHGGVAESLHDRHTRMSAEAEVLRRLAKRHAQDSTRWTA